MKKNFKVIGAVALLAALTVGTLQAASTYRLSSIGVTTLVDSANGIGGPFGVGTSAYAGTNSTANTNIVRFDAIYTNFSVFADVQNYTGVVLSVSWMPRYKTNFGLNFTNMAVVLGYSVDGVHMDTETQFPQIIGDGGKHAADSIVPACFTTNLMTMGYPYVGVYKVVYGNAGSNPEDYAYQWASNLLIQVAPSGPLH